MKKVVAALTLLLGSTALADYSITTQIYYVNFDWMTSAGADAFPTFTAPNGYNVHYEPFQVSGPTCLELGVNSINGTDQIIWYQLASGAWSRLADDVVSGLNPYAVIYVDTVTNVPLRISDYYSSPEGWMQVRTEYVPPPTTGGYEAHCDAHAAWRGWPYLKKKAGVITVSNVR
jgi:hypothetical protein